MYIDEDCMKRGWFVDCEYNKVADDVKAIPAVRKLEKEIAEAMAKTLKELLGSSVNDLGELEEVYEKPIYPDIIVHQRGGIAPKFNLCVIEFKKDSVPDDGDHAKLVELTTGIRYENIVFGYQMGLFVGISDLSKENEPKSAWWHWQPYFGGKAEEKRSERIAIG